MTTFHFPADTAEGVIERKYMPALLRISTCDADAHNAFLGFVQKTEGADMSPHIGDRLLEFAKTDDETMEIVQRLRIIGVRDDDIRYWHNLHPLERNCLTGTMETMRTAKYLEGLSQDRTPADIAIDVFKTFPRFGNPNDTDWGGELRHRLTEDDRPLPYELFVVISDYIAAKQREPSFAKTQSEATSMNAVIRIALQRGELHRVAAESACLGTSSMTRTPAVPSGKTGCAVVILLFAVSVTGVGFLLI